MNAPDQAVVKNSVNTAGLLRPAMESIHLLALGVWAGLLLMVGATAAVTFPKLAALDVRIPGFEGYDAEHHRIAAGQVMNLAFTVSDWLGLACLLVATGCFGVVLRLRRKQRGVVGPALVLRIVALVAVAILSLFSTFAFRPSLNASFENLWAAAEAGENERAIEIRDKLAPRHAKASFLLTTQLALVLIAGLAGGFDAASQAEIKPSGVRKR